MEEERERSETMEQSHPADATPSGHTVAVCREFPETEQHSAENPLTNRNRQNAQHSTGPRTEEGKAASSRNALKHGLSIQRHVILKHEDPAQYEQLLVELREIFEPQSAREYLAVEDIAECRWALRRFAEAEASLFDLYFGHEASNESNPGDRMTYGRSLGFSCIQEPDESQHPELPAFLLLQRYRGHWDRRHQRALAEFDRAQRARRAEAAEQRRQAQEARRDENQSHMREAHSLRMAILDEKLARERHRTVNTAPPSAAESTPGPLQAALDELLKNPPPGLSASQLADLGFVSSDNVHSREQGSSSGTSPWQ